MTGTGPITIHLLSDSLGETADALARAVTAQFPPGAFRTERLPKVASVEQLVELVHAHCGHHCVFFFTIIEQGLLAEMRRLVAEENVRGVDILGPGIDLLAGVSGIEPRGVAGAIREPDEAYFDRIEAMEFAINHDDGRNPEGLVDADVVLIGVSRTSKTPLCVYLASKGLRAANIPLVRGTEPPVELFDVDPRRVFGLVSSAPVLAEIRSKRMVELGTYVAHYADRDDIERDLDEARAVMRRIGCIVVRTDNRAVEETAQEVIRYLRGGLETHD
jgi:[pyruvate, water dikinase]-phosphate phosphotransferase / [pyruvate, water dikinase] kinase